VFLFNPFNAFPFHLLQDNEKRTPLHAAAYLGDAEIIELLILSGTFLKRGFMYKSFFSHIHFCHSCSVDHLQVSIQKLEPFIPNIIDTFQAI